MPVVPHQFLEKKKILLLTDKWAAAEFFCVHDQRGNTGLQSQAIYHFDRCLKQPEKTKKPHQTGVVASISLGYRSLTMTISLVPKIKSSTSWAGMQLCIMIPQHLLFYLILVYRER